MFKKVVIIGAGGHAKVIADIIEKSGDIIYGFLDDNLPTNTIVANNKKWKVIGKSDMRFSLASMHKNLSFIIAIGNNYVRKMISQKDSKDIKYYTAIHPSANIGANTSIGEGSVVMANVCINSSAKVGKHCILNTASVIEHDNVIGDFVHISPNATLCGTVTVGDLTHIGAGATIKNNITISDNSIIGAGAVVVKNIQEDGTYIGVPAKILDKDKQKIG